MDEELALKLLENSSASKWYPSFRGRIPGNDWFLLEIDPMPYKEEIYLVIADIIKEYDVYPAVDGRVYHWDECNNTNHEIPKLLTKAIDLIDETTFKVAVYKGKENLLNGQPIAIPLDPVISYSKYPDHPHLNAGGQIYIKNRDFYIPKIEDNRTPKFPRIKNDDPPRYKFYLPDSLCYHYSPLELGNTEYDRLFNAFNQIQIWLFRHQLWLATRKILGVGKGIWIGPQKGRLIEGDYLEILNPIGECRCGSGKKYLECHMLNDICISNNCSKDEVIKKLNINFRTQKWLNNRSRPEEYSLRMLNLATKE